jgi:hypothetical protein
MRFYKAIVTAQGGRKRDYGTDGNNGMDGNFSSFFSVCSVIFQAFHCRLIRWPEQSESRKTKQEELSYKPSPSRRDKTEIGFTFRS